MREVYIPTRKGESYRNKEFTEDEKADLFLRAHSGDEEARARFVESAMQLVDTIVDKMPPKFFQYSMSKEDAKGYGILGVLDCIKNVDPERIREAAVNTYLYRRIRGAIIDAFRTSEGCIVKVGRSAYNTINQWEKTREVLTKELEREPSPEEIEERCHIFVSRYIKSKEHVDRKTLGFGTHETTESMEPGTSDESFDLFEEIDAIGYILGELPQQESIVLYLHHFRNLTLKEIGDAIGLSESRICQLHNKAIELAKRYACPLSNEFDASVLKQQPSYSFPSTPKPKWIGRRRFYGNSVEFYLTNLNKYDGLGRGELAVIDPSLYQSLRKSRQLHRLIPHKKPVGGGNNRVPEHIKKDIIISHSVFRGDATEAARHFPYSRVTVGNIWSGEGLELRGIGWNKLPQEKINRILELRRTGKSTAEIGKHLGCGKTTVVRYLNKPIETEDVIKSV